MTECTEERGGPFGTVDPKRTFDRIPVQLDWHDYLINRRVPGASVVQDFRMRPRRDPRFNEATGVQYRCTIAGVSSYVPWHRIHWPKTVGETVLDGSVIWTAEAISSSSLRSTVANDDWPAVTGLTLDDESNSDMIYTVHAAGGTDGQDYEIRHRITLANGEQKEGLIILPVRD